MGGPRVVASWRELGGQRGGLGRLVGGALDRADLKGLSVARRRYHDKIGADVGGLPVILAGEGHKPGGIETDCPATVVRLVNHPVELVAESWS
jgi:hypothetical protein